MREDVRIELRRIGELLDASRFPVVRNGGIVVPGEPVISPRTVGTESNHVRPGKARTETRSRAWESDRQGTPSRAWSRTGPGAPRSAAPLVVSELYNKFSHELIAVQQAYPGTQHWLDDDSMWFIAESSLLPGFSHKAVFVVAIRFADGLVRGWGFWGTEVIGYEWIGPRHTNFPDGSICAFEPADGTWTVSDSLVELLDLYTLWAVRHLHLRVFGRWPGFQAVRHSYERILELRADEYCGCGTSRLYGKCCRDADLARNQVREAVAFTIDMRGGLRRPPASLVNFLRDRGRTPDLGDVLA
ncbi:hypothetical protein Y027_261 [Burkholderia pseudomallei TSV5]|nr:hypothetical protein Y027_261 [Burkholderia pseudomallei TSV5]